MQRVIIATHGELSKGMLNSITMIVGDLAKDIETYSLYPGQSPNDYVNVKEQSIKESDDEFIFITDIKGGSVYNAIFTLTKYPNVKLFSGMNMSLVLEILLSNQQSVTVTKANQLLDNAKLAITYTSNENLETMNKEAEDF